MKEISNELTYAIATKRDKRLHDYTLEFLEHNLEIQGNQSGSIGRAAFKALFALFDVLLYYCNYHAMIMTDCDVAYNAE